MSVVDSVRTKLAQRYGLEAVQPAEVDKQGYHLALAVPPGKILDLAEVLKSQTFFLEFVTGVDRGETIELVYLFGLFEGGPCRIKASFSLPKGQAAPSLALVMPTANWHEREAYDMLGVKFTGHPDLRRLLLPEDADFHPLLRDFQAPVGPYES